MSKAGKVFKRIYAEKVWGEGSGGGSTPELLSEYIAKIEELVLQYLPLRVLDIGCGYGWIARAINWHGAQYIGLDVAREAIEHIDKIVAGQFFHADAIDEGLPDAEMVILKEVTQHLDNASIHKLIEQLRAYPVVVHCSIVGEANEDIEMGGTRGVDLSKEPFNLSCETVLCYEIPGSRYLCQVWRP